MYQVRCNLIVSASARVELASDCLSNEFSQSPLVSGMDILLVRHLPVSFLIISG